MKFKKSSVSRLQNNQGSSTESGQISRILIISAVILLVIIVIVYGVIKFFSTNKSQVSKTDNSLVVTPAETPKLIYEYMIGDIKFLIQSSENLGNILESQLSYENDLTTTEKFIKVVIGAQNKGKNNIAQYSWEIGDIVDSEGRNFISINDRAYSWLPKPDLCGALLKPEFEPIPCVKYYEVSKVSTNLRIVVKVTQPKKEETFLDLNLNLTQ